MPDAVKALPLLLLDPVFATCLVVAVVLPIVFFRMQKEKSLTAVMRAALITLFALTAGTALFTVVMLFLFGPPPG